MKIPVSMIGIPGLFLAVQCLGGPALAGTNAPVASATETSLATAPASSVSVSTPNALRLSPWTREIVKLAQSGVEEEVMFAFVGNAGVFGLGADQIIYLNDLGIPGAVIRAMLQHDREVVSGERLLTIVSEPPYEPLFPAKPVAANRNANRSSPAATAGRSAGVAPHIRTAETVSPARPPLSANPVEGTHAFMYDPAHVERKRPLYPVREPYAVELLPPIVFCNMAGVTPNTLIVYGFPKP